MRQSRRLKKSIIRYKDSNNPRPAAPRPAAPRPAAPRPAAPRPPPVAVQPPVQQAVQLRNGTISKFSDINDNVDDYEFYKENFTVINDDIQKRYNIIIDKYQEKLQPIFENGVASLELKKPIEVKKTFSWRKLKNGDYHTDSSKSDKNNADRIATIVNNFPSFKIYKNVDNLEWIYKNHRLLLVEILERYEFKSITTIKTMITAMLRVMGLALKLQKKNLLYLKYAEIQKALDSWTVFDEGDNKLNENEKVGLLYGKKCLRQEQNLRKILIK